MRIIRRCLLVGLLLPVCLLSAPGASAGDDGWELESLKKAFSSLGDAAMAWGELAEGYASHGMDREAAAARAKMTQLIAEQSAVGRRLQAVLARMLEDAPPAPPLPRPPAESDEPFEGPDEPIQPVPGGLSGRGGHRNLRTEGGTQATQSAVDLGLEWLKQHQEPEGYWDCDGFAKQCKLNRCDGAGYALYDTGVTGLALLAFLGAGETHRNGRYKDTIKNGLKYLKQVQDPEGCFGPRTTNRFTYNHAVASLAMTEAFALTGSPIFRNSAQRAVDFIAKAQNPYLAWRYGVRPQDNDTSVTGWMISALYSAKLAKLRVPSECFDGAKAWLDKATEPEYGRVGYTARGTGPARPQDLMDKFPPDKSEALTAEGVLMRVFLGEQPRSSEMIQKGASLCLKVLPEWNESGGNIDMYYWYWGTLAMFQVGGEPWKVWNESMKAAIIDHQRKDGDQKGSWDPVGVWGREGGRVYSTALMTMCLEVYYRYARVQGTRPSNRWGR